MHKTQGQTYNEAIITPSSFTYGQLYVALSRVRAIEGVYLTQPIVAQDIQANPLIIDFYSTFDFEVPASIAEKRKKLDKAAADKKKKKSTKKKTTSTKTSKTKTTKKTTKKKTSKSTTTKSKTTKKNSSRKKST